MKSLRLLYNGSLKLTNDLKWIVAVSVACASPSHASTAPEPSKASPEQVVNDALKAVAAHDWPTFLGLVDYSVLEADQERLMAVAKILADSTAPRRASTPSAVTEPRSMAEASDAIEYWTRVLRQEDSVRSAHAPVSKARLNWRIGSTSITGDSIASVSVHFAGTFLPYRLTLRSTPAGWRLDGDAFWALRLAIVTR